MNNLLEKHFSKLDQKRLRTILPMSVDHDLDFALLIVATEVNLYLKYDVMSLEMATGLLIAGLANREVIQPQGHLAQYMVFSVNSETIRGFKNLISDQIDKPGKASVEYDFSFMASNQTDPYAEDFDWDGGTAEFDPAYVGMGKYAGWGEPCLLMTKERLLKELSSSDWRRLLHRTPYRPMLDKRCLQDLFDTKSV